MYFFLPSNIYTNWDGILILELLYIYRQRVIIKLKPMCLKFEDIFWLRFNMLIEKSYQNYRFTVARQLAAISMYLRIYCYSFFFILQSMHSCNYPYPYAKRLKILFFTALKQEARLVQVPGEGHTVNSKPFNESFFSFKAAVSNLLWSGMQEIE